MRAHFDGPQTSDERVSARLCVALSLIVLALLLATTRGSSAGDDAFHVATADGWLSRRSAVLPSLRWRAALLTVRDAEGRLYSNLDPGMPALLLPFVAAGRASDRLGLRPLAGDLADVYGLGVSHELPMRVVEPLRAANRDPRVLASALAVATAGALAAFALLLALREAGFGPRVVVAAAAALGLGWPLVVYGGTLWTQVPALGALGLALLLVARTERGAGWVPALGAGLAAGAAALCRFDLWLVVPVIGFAVGLGARRRPRAGAVLASFAAGVVVAGIAYAGWALSTRGYLHPPRRGGFLAQPWWEGALLLTLSPAKGVVVFAPWLLLAPLGIAPLWRRSPALAVAAVGIFAVQLATFATWFDWGSGMAYGPRFLAPAAAVLALPSAAALEGAQRVRRLAFGALVAVGLVVSIPGALQFPRVHDVERDTAWRRVAPVEAWRALLSSDDTRSEYLVLAPGVDSLSTREPLMAVLAIAAASGGALLLRSRPRRANAHRQLAA